MNRRTVLQLLGTAGIAQAGVALGPFSKSQAKELLLRPQDFGAKVDGTTLDSPSINAAIDRAHGQGGGMVYLSPGIYLCGTVVLKSNVTLYIEAGAVILGSKDIKQYQQQPGQNSFSQKRHLILTQDAENVTLCGAGLIDGQGSSFWVPSGRQNVPPEEQWGDVASLYLKHRSEVSPMLEFVNCRHLNVEQIRIEGASGWTMRLLNCVGVVVDGIYIKNSVTGPNTDGMDITNSSDVRIANCSIDTGDDAICLKSENPYGDSIPSMRNVTVTNCTLTTCCNGFKFGTATKGGCENIVFSNSTIHNTAESKLGERVISGICLEMVDGGWLENVVITGICMQRTRTPIFLRLGARTPPRDGGKSYMRGVMISDVYATEAVLTNSITGLPGMPVEDVTLSNIHVETQEPGKREWTQREIPEVPRAYPEARMFGRLPAYGMYVRHARGIRMHNVVFESATTEQRPAVVCDDVTSLEIAGLRVPMQGNVSPVIDLRQTKDAWIRDGRAPKDAPSLVSVAGADSVEILVSGCDLLRAKQAVTIAADASQASVTLANNILSKNVS
ncbi:MULTISPECIES: glycoside hydrolase family 28 protein [Acidobacteriaceae]|uniref:glycoside hydrolase family 28 protein n=1 Tax=Acidobacteriaceae TaxID=204434 RepID=UPI00131E3449|nr:MULTISPECIES: glycosyl hydrolase family 28 protein [Acidobacteriaceae]MDW5267435.1 glycosyl hydrolase family 28 protein [Edaphobacter sp.]